MILLKRIALMVFFFGITLSYGQSWEWMNNCGGLKSDKGTTIAVDADKNSYITGYYNEEANFGPHNTGFSFSHSKEAFVAKLDSNGNYLWVRNGLNYYDDRGLGLCLDPAGNVYITGTCWGGLQWGSLNVYNSTSYTDQIFVIKLDPNGNEIWMKNAGVDQTGFLYSDDHGHDIASDSQGNIFVTGHIGNNDWAPQMAHFGSIDIPMNSGDTLGFVAKLTNDGTWQWVKTFGGVYYFRDNDIAIDNDDNVYVTGGFKGTRTFGTTTLNSVQNSLDIYVVKYDNDGLFQWVTQVGDSLDDRGDGICYGNDEHMYVTGEFRAEVYFGTDDLNNYGGPEDKDIFVAKLTKDGNWVWASKAGSKKGGDRGVGICASNDGKIFVSGQFKDVAKFGDIQVDAGLDQKQFFVAAIDNQGIWQWVLEGGGPYNDRAAFLACDDDCNVYVTGFFKESMTVSDTINLTSYGLNDIWVAKIKDACDGFGSSPPEEGETPPEGYSGEVTHSNVFSPNGDGINDFLTFVDAENAKGKIVVTNRWGNVVYETKSLLLPWNGNDTSGKPLVDGTYFYIVKIERPDGETEEFHGHVTIVR